MATVTLGSKAVGSTVKLKVNGVAREFIIVHQGRPSSLYDASCNGTWLLMKDIYEKRQWHSYNINDYAESTIHSYLNSTFLNLFEANIRNQIKQVKIPYRPGSGPSANVNSGANGLRANIFLLSGVEIGGKTDVEPRPHDGAKLAYFEYGNDTSADNKRRAYLNGSATNWWLRSPTTYGSTEVWVIVSSGNCEGASGGSNSYGIRPALILPTTLLVSGDGAVYANTAPTTPGNISVPQNIQGGGNVKVSWAASTDAENNLEGYKLERSTDGGSTWTQIYQGSSTSYTNTVAFGTESVMYRVRAYDADGLHSGYRTSGQVSVFNNHAPVAPASITVPEKVLGGNPLTVTWSAASDVDGNLTGYELERQVNGGDWAQVYKGAATSYTDTITRGWASVNYRVRAYDACNAYSGYTTGMARQVDNNRAPTITCDTASGTDLEKKDAGFELTYSVGDEDGDPVTVTEAIDGVTKRTYTPEPGANNSFAVTGEYFMCLLNGRHTMTIMASDGQAATTHKLTFTKEVTEATITLAEPMAADDKITICVLSVAGDIPADAEYKVEVTNNGGDDAPVWEDCTMEVRNGGNHIFENQTAAKGFAFNFRVSVKRGPSGQGGYISSVRGGFQ